jgi:hypothetical protein
VPQSPTLTPVKVPPLTALAHALCWTAQLLWSAALALTNVSSLTLNGRSPVDDSTGGGGPPREPVKVWTFVPEVAVGVADATASVVEATLVAAGGSTVMVDGAGQADSTIELVATSVEEGAATAPPVAAPDPATAAEISAAVASSTRRF